MQRFSRDLATYAYSPAHAPIGTVEPGETFAVECVEGWSGYFRAPEDFTPAAHHAAEAVKWAVTGPIAVAGARPGDAIAITIHDVALVGPGVAVYGPYTNPDPLAWWDEETGAAIYASDDGLVRFDEHTALPARPLIGCLAVAPADGEVHAMMQGPYGGNMDCKHLVAGSTLVLPCSHPGGGLYFGDCKSLMGDGEIVAPPEVEAVVTATAEVRTRPPSLRWPRLETADRFTTIVSGAPLEVAAREAFAQLLDWVLEEHDLDRIRAGLLLAMIADAGICQISNTLSTAYCTAPRAPLAPYATHGGEA